VNSKHHKTTKNQRQKKPPPDIGTCLEFNRKRRGIKR